MHNSLFSPLCLCSATACTVSPDSFGSPNSNVQTGFFGIYSKVTPEKKICLLGGWTSVFQPVALQWCIMDLSCWCSGWHYYFCGVFFAPVQLCVFTQILSSPFCRWNEKQLAYLLTVAGADSYFWNEREKKPSHGELLCYLRSCQSACTGSSGDSAGDDTLERRLRSALPLQRRKTSVE